MVLKNKKLFINKMAVIARCCLSHTVRTLNTKYKCVGIKTSFEDEGAQFNDIIKLRTLTSENGIKLSIKVGGAEAKTDIKSSVDLCCDSIVGPMIESKYAFEKYVQSCKNIDTVTKGVNIETIQAIDNIDLILSSQYLSDIDYFVIGRVDLMGSLGQSRDNIDSLPTQALIEDTFKKIKRHNKKTYLGGSISSKSKEFIKSLYDKGLLDYIETRYIIMKLDSTFFDTFDEAIVASHGFEHEWMQYLYKKYFNMSTQFNDRIQMAKTRINKTFIINNKTLCYNVNDLKSDDLKVCDYTVSFTSDYIHSFFKPGDFIISDDRFKKIFGTSNIFYIVATENNKSIETAMNIIKVIDPSIKRIVVIGGGLIQDIGSFVSSVYHRGIPWIYFPTTLLSMADSCIGSKTSLNTTSVKNKIGTYCSPNSVYINMMFLETLDDIQIKSGMGEILKMCMIGNALHMYKSLDLKSLIKLSLLIKKSVIEEDLFDKNVRKGLNYGHTIGHALEVLTDYTIPHGLAVVHGMMLMNKIFDYKNSLFEKYCLELIVNDPMPKFDYSCIKKIIDQDKKRFGEKITCIVPKSAGHVEFITSSSQKIQDQLLSTVHS